jgi:cysteinyl-tRNA synthetase
MSKSLGNVILVSDILRQYNPAVVRLALMSTQYRQPLNWTENTIINAENILQKISKSLDNNKNTYNQKDEEFIKLLCDDLNTPNAIQYLVKQAKLAKNNNEELAKLRYNCDLLGIKNNNVKNDISAEDKEAIQKLIIERELARKNKDFAQADSIRVKLSSLNVELEDTPDGATWKIKH